MGRMKWKIVYNTAQIVLQALGCGIVWWEASKVGAPESLVLVGIIFSLFTVVDFFIFARKDFSSQG